MAERLSIITVHDLTERELLVYRDRTERLKKSPLVTWLLWLFTGGVGGHRYYLGNTGRGIAMTLTLGGLGVWTLIDAFFIGRALRQNEADVEAIVLQEISAMRARDN